VVASKIEKIPDYNDIEKEKIVFFCEPENPKDMARQIIRFLTDEQMAREISSRGRDYVLEHKSWQKIVKQILNLVEKIKKEKR
jgi:glycosyltransferase involved in cell wall biosynthesis